MSKIINFINGFMEVNGLSMYYEMYGKGNTLVLIHGGGSTIQTSFGRIIPELAKHRKIIAVELQAHGRTNDRNTNLTFTQDADDVAVLLKKLAITKADFLGFSNGGQTTIEIAIRHSHLVNKIIICSAFYKKEAVPPAFWKGFEGEVSFNQMPQPYKDEFLKINNNPAALLNMFHKDVQRMKTFKGWTDEQMESIKAPALVVNGNKDVGSPEHAVEMFRIIPDCQLAILPGGHGDYLGEITTLKIKDKENAPLLVPIIEEFLSES